MLGPKLSPQQLAIFSWGVHFKFDSDSTWDPAKPAKKHTWHVFWEVNQKTSRTNDLTLGEVGKFVSRWSWSCWSYSSGVLWFQRFFKNLPRFPGEMIKFDIFSNGLKPPTTGSYGSGMLPLLSTTGIHKGSWWWILKTPNMFLMSSWCWLLHTCYIIFFVSKLQHISKTFWECRTWRLLINMGVTPWVLRLQHWKLTRCGSTGTG